MIIGYVMISLVGSLLITPVLAFVWWPISIWWFLMMFGGIGSVLCLSLCIAVLALQKKEEWRDQTYTRRQNLSAGILNYILVFWVLFCTTVLAASRVVTFQVVFSAYSSINVSKEAVHFEGVTHAKICSCYLDNHWFGVLDYSRYCSAELLDWVLYLYNHWLHYVLDMCPCHAKSRRIGKLKWPPQLLGWPFFLFS